MARPLDIDAYLARIGYRGPRDPSLEVLRALHLAHLRGLAFENLSIHRGEPIVLDEGALFDKIVTRRRGGFCYELNGLFAALLEALGFRVSRLAARVYDDGVLGIPFDHLALRVDLDEPWLADVGFGDGFSLPLRLRELGDQADGARRYRIEPRGDQRVLIEMRPGSPPRPQFLFEERAHALADFAEACQYHQTSPDSPFTRKRVCSRVNATGRVTVTGNRLLFTSQWGTRVEFELTPEAADAAVERLL